MTYYHRTSNGKPSISPTSNSSISPSSISSNSFTSNASTFNNNNKTPMMMNSNTNTAIPLHGSSVQSFHSITSQPKHSHPNVPQFNPSQESTLGTPTIFNQNNNQCNKDNLSVPPETDQSSKCNLEEIFINKMEEMSIPLPLSIINKKFPSYSYIDSHCHLDLILQKYPANYKTIEMVMKEANGFVNCKLKACITNFVFPDIYRTPSYQPTAVFQSIIQHDQVFFTIGCHPKFAHLWNVNLENFIIHIHKTFPGKLKGIGECGLDYTEKCKVPEDTQKYAFKAQINLALQLDLPLVIHCRNAEGDCFNIMNNFNLNNYPIHRHCFQGSPLNLSILQQFFNRMVFSFSPIILYSSDTDTKKAIAELSESKILIETDSPFFLPPSMKKKYQCCNPGMAFAVAYGIHLIRSNSTISEVLQFTTANAKQFYKL